MNENTVYNNHSDQQDPILTTGPNPSADMHPNTSSTSNPEEIPLKTTARFHFLQDGIRSFYRHMGPVPGVHEPLKTASYKAFMNRYRNDPPYQYPEESSFVFFPERILWSKLPGCYFVIGRNLKGNKIKLRVFGSAYYFAGVSFRHPWYGIQGSKWFVGCIQADHAMNLEFAFPMDITTLSIPDPRTLPTREELTTGLSLAEQLEELELLKKV